MNGLTVAAIVVATLWLGILTLLTLLIVRQIGLLTVRLDYARGPAFDPEADGLAIGTAVPPEARAALPTLASEPVVLLIVSATCSPCREVVDGLAGQLPPGAERRLIALVAGDEAMADGLVAMLPPGVRSVRDPQATAIATGLGIQSTPFALAVDGGVVSGKIYVHHAADLTRLLGQDDASEHKQRAAPSLITISPRH